MTDQRTIDRLIAHLRAHVAELRRLKHEEAQPRELEQRTHLIARPQHNQLSYAVATCSTPSPRHRTGPR